MRARPGLHVIVIGGGIGGLAAALALERAGHDIEVFEQAPALQEVGAGLTVWSNAVGVLDRLGAGERVRADSTEIEWGENYDREGRRLSRIPVGAIGRRLGAPSVCIHRADLLLSLRDSLETTRVHLGSRCVGFEQGGRGVSVRFADGGTVHGDVLVGADGIRSTVRASLRDEPLQYAGWISWRGIAPMDFEPFDKEAFFSAWGPGAWFGALHLPGNRVFWFATANAPEDGADGPAGRMADVIEHYRGFAAPVGEILDATPAGEVLRNDIHDRMPVRSGGELRATLLGDAAHPTTPSLGMGACLAIEDTEVLSAALEESPPEEALRAYERRRRRPVTRVVRSSRRMGDLLQLENPVLCRARDLAVRLSPDRLTARSVRSLLRGA